MMLFEGTRVERVVRQAKGRKTRRITLLYRHPPDAHPRLILLSLKLNHRQKQDLDQLLCPGAKDHGRAENVLVHHFTFSASGLFKNLNL